jgi:hypothetical protein
VVKLPMVEPTPMEADFTALFCDLFDDQCDIYKHSTCHIPITPRSCKTIYVAKSIQRHDIFPDLGFNRNTFGMSVGNRSISICRTAGLPVPPNLVSDLRALGG